MSNAQQRTCRVNTTLAEAWRMEAGLTIEDLANDRHMPLSKKTIQRLLHGKPVYLHTIRAYAGFFGHDAGELLNGEMAEVSPREPPTTSVGDWEIIRPLGPVEEAPNGLQYRRYQLARLDDATPGRGKRFVLDHLSLEERLRVQEHLLRHTNVCNQVGGHPNLARHLELKGGTGEDLWWVIDEWIDGEFLADRLQRGPLDLWLLASVMRDVAVGLDALHQNHVILRQLSPRSVAIGADNHTAVILDFEMAKLLDRRPTVSPSDRWPEDDYRAPEIGGASGVSPAADLYSWARVFVHGLTGNSPPLAGQDIKALDGIVLPEGIRTTLKECLSLNRTERPQAVASVLRPLQRWIDTSRV